MKKILGLDLGTNSIGWALVNEAESENEKSSSIINCRQCLLQRTIIKKYC
jgi:CRISPR/Cas system Type II protein with McrA/HNH and RuvC-like nuclease domain